MCRLLQAQHLHMHRRFAACLRLHARRSGVATVAALPCFCVNDFDVKSFSKTQHTQFKTNLSYEQPSSDTTVGKSWGRHHMCSERTKNKILYSQRDVRCRAKIGVQKSVKHKTVYRVNCVTWGNRISLNPYRSLGEGEGGQASSSLAMIHTTGPRRRYSKLQACSEVERGRRI